VGVGGGGVGGVGGPCPDGELTVQDLADDLGLSAGFFSRAFKAATGRSPHAYIVDRRVARARAELASGAEDLSAVALATGFSSHAHLTTTFRQRLGVSPSALRRSLVGGRVAAAGADPAA
jgi:AraC family transcriptional regulator